jgi:FOG: Ankyrin repeat
MNLIAANLRKLREQKDLSQDEFATRIGVARPTISNWENGKIIPTSEQLIALSKEFSVSVDSILGIDIKNETWIIPDTSVLINRPRIIEELSKKFDKIIISDVIISELNNLKDNKKQKRLKQKAWLAMAGIEKHKNNPDGKIKYIQSNSKKEKNDDKIIEIAISEANAHPNSKIFLFSNDVYFSLQKGAPNLEFITIEKYGEIFSENDEHEYNQIETQEFYRLVKSKKVDQAKKMVQKNIDINKIDPTDGFTPLIQAIRKKDEDMIDFLISLPKIDINRKDREKYEFPPISHAIQMNNIGIVKKLVENGCDYDLGSSGKNAGNTPLMIACWSGFKEIAEYLIEEGACLNQQDSNGYTPLIKACIKNHIEIVKILLPITDRMIRCRKEGKTAENHTSNKEIKRLFREDLKANISENTSGEGCQ